MDKLTSWFNSSAKAAKEAEKANKAYEAQAQKTADTIKQINNDEKNNTNERANQLRQDVIDLKTKGATAKEIADAEKKAQEEIRNINMNASKEREKQMKDREKTTEQVLKKEKERLAEIARTKGTGNEKYDEQKKKINELTAAYNELTQAIKEEQQVQNDLILQSAEAILKEKEQKAAAYKEYQSTQKERANAEREAIRQAQDSALALLKEGVEKQRQAINQSYDRQIEDLKRKLQQEKNLTAAAREAINQTIQNIEQQRQNELQKLSGEETKKRIENETRLIDLKLQAIKAGSEAEYQLRLQQLDKQQEAELNNLELTEEMKAAIRDKYQKQNDDLEKQKQLNTLNDQKAAVELEWRQRLEAMQQGSLEESAMKMQQAQTEYDALLSMDAEHKALLYGEGLAAETEYTNAVLDLKEKLRDAETANQEAIKQSTQTQLQAAQAIGQGFEEILNSFAENNETMAGFAKMVALFNIGLNTAEALSAIPSMAAAGDPYTYALRVATAIATVMTNIAKAKQLLSKEKQPKAPKFATGGIVSGPGSASSDSIVANLSSGESILNAPATAMFAPLLSALNQIGGGIPINTVETSQQIIGEEMLARAFARGVEALPAPVVSIEEINSVNARVKILENLSLQ
jgi:hypothetical protein